MNVGYLAYLEVLWKLCGSLLEQIILEDIVGLFFPVGNWDIESELEETEGGLWSAKLYHDEDDYGSHPSSLLALSDYDSDRVRRRAVPKQFNREAATAMRL